ncbi:hypothetical protein [Legionella oakridgensis]|uniref:Uncharacterized protein n=2 Tax=Legionella oakridgensis TaxID=29423 RepID=W0BAN3_9GAMM|nr:hypothetical protein [Legionella oakridgensis]AHE66900.1 hypothetical protein Loa_01347 [Legionella oakridgensis ATCC 33761 = DSM 21215]KTD37149.1 hypothetical protein Loak_2285 [Legionella oakridgensis]STY20006.1 Uncharacterised protein [Legionella longbeachae]
MVNKENFIDINIETLVLVAIWESSCIFQGYFKIIELSRRGRHLLFFRCEAKDVYQSIIHNDFSPYDYEFTHLYHGSNLIQLDTLEQAKDHALYLLKYALYTTLYEMISNRKQAVVLMDDIAMQAMIKKIAPILHGTVDFPVDESQVGFATAMDFCPKEDMGQLAVLALLAALKNEDDASSKIH